MKYFSLKNKDKSHLFFFTCLISLTLFSLSMSANTNKTETGSANTNKTEKGKY